MTKLQHGLYVGLFLVITILVFSVLLFNGYDYYFLPLEDKFFSPQHHLLKPSGALGHGFGIIGSILMLLGVLIYMIRKRVRAFVHVGILKHWLELHIFLCTVGPILILYHTAFKFGGIVSVSFWSMVAVFLSGIIGRFIYVRIPRTIEGNEMNIQQINVINDNLSIKLATDYNLLNTTLEKISNFSKIEQQGKGSFSNLLFTIIPNYFENQKKIKLIKAELKQNNISKFQTKEIIKTIKEKISISNKIHYLRLMQSLFKYWHVAHLPFALIMLIIMLIHIIVTVAFGYRWIF